MYAKHFCEKEADGSSYRSNVILCPVLPISADRYIRIVSSRPRATYREADPPTTLERPTLPPLNPRSTLCGDLPASFAARSTILRVDELLPIFQTMSVRTLTFACAERNRFQRSEFSSGRPDALHQLFARHVAARLKLLIIYRESVTISTR